VLARLTQSGDAGTDPLCPGTLEVRLASPFAGCDEEGTSCSAPEHHLQGTSAYGLELGQGQGSGDQLSSVAAGVWCYVLVILHVVGVNRPPVES